MDSDEPGDVEPLGELTAFDTAKVSDKDKLGGIDAPESFGAPFNRSMP
jgi:hypothetical protein